MCFAFCTARVKCRAGATSQARAGRIVIGCMTDAAPAPAIPKPLFAYALLYGGMTCIAGVLGFKQVALGPLAVESGIFAFLMLVVISSSVAQLYGAATANRMVRWGFAPLALSIVLIALVLQLPPAPTMPAAMIRGVCDSTCSNAETFAAGIVGAGGRLSTTKISAIDSASGTKPQRTMRLAVAAP